MTWFIYVSVIVATFAVLFVLDFGFQKLFRRKQQYHTGLAVHLNKRYLVAGILIAALGVAMLGQLSKGFSWLIVAAAVILEIMGLGLLIYYNTFGLFYDNDTFIYHSFGHKPATYRYEDIKSQQLFTSAAGILVELDLSDGRTLSLQQNMDGMYAFLDKASLARFRQLGIDNNTCKWFDKSNSCWFPPREEA